MTRSLTNLVPVFLNMFNYWLFGFHNKAWWNFVSPQEINCWFFSRQFLITFCSPKCYLLLPLNSCLCIALRIEVDKLRIQKPFGLLNY